MNNVVDLVKIFNSIFCNYQNNRANAFLHTKSLFWSEIGVFKDIQMPEKQVSLPEDFINRRSK
jgi:hypothetical protein